MSSFFKQSKSQSSKTQPAPKTISFVVHTRNPKSSGALYLVCPAGYSLTAESRQAIGALQYVNAHGATQQVNCWFQAGLTHQGLGGGGAVYGSLGAARDLNNEAAKAAIAKIAVLKKNTEKPAGSAPKATPATKTKTAPAPATKTTSAIKVAKDGTWVEVNGRKYLAPTEPEIVEEEELDYELIIG